ncbi:hypothetical protein BGZ46_010422 [Entomortierella lignicola]|nr:hypothetical protein BGZ46_010422 [Entomortierella lignicola]
MSSNSPPPVLHSPVLSAQPVRGILKRAASRQPLDERAPRLKWDEENLLVTEAQKDSTMKIDEPKTPFVYYDQALDKDMELDDAFSLDCEKKKRAQALKNAGGKHVELEVNEDDGDESSEEEPEEWQDSDEEDEDEDEDEDESKKIDHDKFARMRAEHYKMKEALKLGHELAEEELAALQSPTGSEPVPPLPSFAKFQNSTLEASKAKGNNMDL